MGIILISFFDKYGRILRRRIYFNSEFFFSDLCGFIGLCIIWDTDFIINYYFAVPFIVSCLLYSAVHRTTCGGHFAYVSGCLPTIINERSYYVIEPVRTVNLVHGAVVFAPEFYEFDLVHSLCCRHCGGCVGFAFMDLYYLHYVQESYEPEIMFVDGYDSESDTDSSDRDDSDEGDIDSDMHSDESGYFLSDTESVAASFVRADPSDLVYTDSDSLF